MLERIANIKAELKYIETHKSVLEDLKRELEELQNHVKEKESILLKENKDVEELEKMSFKSIFHSIVGNKDDKLMKERYEASKASLEYQRVLLNYNLKKDEVERLEIRIQKEESLLEELEELQLTVNDNPELSALKTKLEGVHAELKEVDEALETGEKALSALTLLESFMYNAYNWCTYDMFSDGFLTNLAKKEKIHKAQEQLQVAQNAIATFERELKDVSINKLNKLEFDKYEYVMDFYFDNIFAEYKVKTKIKESLDMTRTVLGSVNDVVKTLKDKKYMLDELYKDTDSKLKKVLMEL